MVVLAVLNKHGLTITCLCDTLYLSLSTHTQNMYIHTHIQVPDAADDLLAAAVLDQRPVEWMSQEARGALAALPGAFPITVRD